MIPQLKVIVGDESAKIGQGRAFKIGWIGKGTPLSGEIIILSLAKHELSRFGTEFIGRKHNDLAQSELLEIRNTDTLAAGEKALSDLRKRKLAYKSTACFINQ
jgi:phenylalanyl-tRNA synthetase alpha chain